MDFSGAEPAVMRSLHLMRAPALHHLVEVGRELRRASVQDRLAAPQDEGHVPGDVRHPLGDLLGDELADEAAGRVADEHDPIEAALLDELDDDPRVVGERDLLDLVEARSMPGQSTA